MRLPVAPAALLAALLCITTEEAWARLSADDVLGAPPAFQIESVAARFTYYDQMGHGYQSRALGLGQPWKVRGSEELLVAEPQLEVVARQGERLTHRISVPVDIVSAASPDAIDAVNGVDVVTGASRYNEAGAINIVSTYRLDPRTDITVRGDVHLEVNFRSWMLGLGASRSFAEDNTVVSASVNQVVDWFDEYDLHGAKMARVFRSTTNGNLGVTQLLSPTTVAQLGYGVTVQSGQLSNTFNTVPLSSGRRVLERLPDLRHRHALSARLAQYLPWRGALHGAYRFYVDSWGLLSHTVEVQLYQRVARFLYLRGTYRLHRQNAVSFFYALAPPEATYMTADSDLEDFMAHTLGLGAVVDLRLRRPLSFEIGYDRYMRSNDLYINIYSCSASLRF